MADGMHLVHVRRELHQVDSTYPREREVATYETPLCKNYFTYKYFSRL
jgi:hypothetical protein